jgi:hypothetical protein
LGSFLIAGWWPAVFCVYCVSFVVTVTIFTVSVLVLFFHFIEVVFQTFIYTGGHLFMSDEGSTSTYNIID